MAFGQYNLSRIQTLQASLQPLAQALLDRAKDQGINLSVVQASRTPAEQQNLFTSGAGVTNAPAFLSYHNYGLAFDVVPEEYANLKDWNPGGELWPRIGAIGEGLGLEWGGRWTTPDRPHFQVPEQAAPIRELKAYWDKFKAIMPVNIAPAAGGAVAILAIVALWSFWLRPMLQDKGYL